MNKKQFVFISFISFVILLISCPHNFNNAYSQELKLRKPIAIENNKLPSTSVQQSKLIMRKPIVIETQKAEQNLYLKPEMPLQPTTVAEQDEKIITPVIKETKTLSTLKKPEIDIKKPDIAKQLRPFNPNKLYLIPKFDLKLTQKPKQNTQEKISLDDFVLYVKKPYDEAFFLSTGAILKNNLKIDSLNAQKGWIFLSDSNKKELVAFIAPVEKNLSILRITPANGVYNISKCTVKNIFTDIKNEIKLQETASNTPQ